MEEKDLTRKEIRGINARQLIWIFSGMACILFSVVMSYSNIMYTLKDNQKTNVGLQLQVDILKADLRSVQQNQAAQDIRLTRIEVEIKDKIFIKDAP